MRLFATFSNYMTITFVVSTRFMLTLRCRMTKLFTTVALHLTQVTRWRLALSKIGNNDSIAYSFYSKWALVNCCCSSRRSSLRLSSKDGESNILLTLDLTVSYSGCNFIRKIVLGDQLLEALVFHIEQHQKHERT